MSYLGAEAGNRSPGTVCDQEHLPVMPEELAARVASAIAAESARREATSRHA